MSQHVKKWRQITNDKFLLDLVQSGASIDFVTIPEQETRPVTRVREQLAPFLDAEIAKFLDKGIIVETEPEPGDYYSTVFLREKKDGQSYRMIINLKPIKRHIVYQKFKMDTALTCMQLVPENGYMAALDLKDAYYSIKVHVDFQKYLKFIWRDKHYMFVVLAMGLAPAPRLFTKLTKPIIATLQRAGHTISPYLDDMFICGRDYDACRIAVEATLQLLASLGLCVNTDKSTITPVQVIEHLGFVIDAREMQVSISESKQNKLEERANALYARPTIRQVMSFLGTAESCMLGVKAGNLQKHAVEAEKNKRLECCNHNLDARMVLTQASLDMVTWWVEHASKHPRPLLVPPVSKFLQTDASKKGWGACLLDKEDGNVIMTAGGAWPTRMKKLPINVLELEAIRRGLEVLLHDIVDTHVLVETDNVTAAAYVNKMGGVVSKRCRVRAVLIWEWLLARNSWATSRYLPGEDNTVADELSRKLTDGMEWQLRPDIFLRIYVEFDSEPQVDLFASPSNSQLPDFYTFEPNDMAIGTDAFLYDWSQYRLTYAFPPFSVLARMAQKIRSDRAEVLAILPVWPTAAWWASMLGLLVSDPVMLPASRTLLTLPSQPCRRHQLLPKLRLIACRLSGQFSRAEAYLSKQAKFSSRAGNQQLLNSTRLTWPNGNFFALQTTLIPVRHLRIT